MTVEQKREIEEKLNWLCRNYEKAEIVGILFTLDVLGYRVYPTEEGGCEIRKK